MVGILLFYWGLLWLGGSNDPYSLESNFARKVDIWFLGENHLYKGFGIPFDPEGIISMIPSIGTVLIGYFMGGMLHTTKNYTDCAKRMSIFGISILIIGWFWGLIFPINKALWTSSYVLFTGGIAAYKSPEIIRRLKESGFRVIPVITKGGSKFITPLTLSSVAEEKCYFDLFNLTDESEMGHIKLARIADLILIAPASANFISKVANKIVEIRDGQLIKYLGCLLYTSPSPRDRQKSRMPSSA